MQGGETMLIASVLLVGAGLVVYSTLVVSSASERAAEEIFAGEQWDEH